MKLTIKPKYQKCCIQTETWQKDDQFIERVLLWRFAEVKVEGKSKKDLQNLLKKRDDFDRVCLSDLFDDYEDELKDCVSDDLYFSESIPEREQKRLLKLFKKDPEAMFESEGWSIAGTKLQLEAELEIHEVD